MNFRTFILGILALTGWGVLSYIVIDSVPKGGYFIATNLFFEMWIEAILFPFFMILTIIIMILEVKLNPNS